MVSIEAAQNIILKNVYRTEAEAFSLLNSFGKIIVADVFAHWDIPITFALPSNPVAAMVGFEMFVPPSILYMMGQSCATD